MKFKVGDRVKILPLATSVSVEFEDINKTGVIISIYSLTSPSYGIIVKMDKICKKIGFRCTWGVGYKMIELYSAKNQQLLFDFIG